MWNRALELLADWQYRMEDVSFSALCHAALGPASCARNFTAGDTSALPPSDRLEWAELRGLNPYLAAEAQAMAAAYGYLPS